MSHKPPPVADCEVDPDRDDDGHDDPTCGGDDCDDLDAAIHPGAPEAQSDGWTSQVAWFSPAGERIEELAATSNGDRVLVAFSSGSTDEAAGSVRFADSEGGWQVSSVASSYDPYDFHDTPVSSPSIAVGDDGRTRIAWLRAWVLEGGTDGELDVAEGDPGDWSRGSVDSNAWIGSRTSVAVDSSGSTHVVYERDGIRQGVGSGDTWAIDEVGTGGAPVVAIDGDEVAVAFVAGLDPEVRLARPGAEGWTTTPVDTASGSEDLPRGARPSLGFDPFGGAHVVFTDGRGVVHVEVRGSEAAAPEVVDPAGRTAVAAVDATGVVHVAYIAASGVFYAARGEAGWQVEPIGSGASEIALAVGRDGRATVLTADSSGERLLAWSNGPLLDGIDSDCDGEDLPPPPDCVDEDGDGQLGLSCGGTDCDDADPAVFLGAPDTVGDGHDQDCDGRDGVDRDDDGHASPESGGDDCDDSQPFVHPGAPEIEDCVDQDCDGLGLPDDDGDGHLRPVCGGDDCDDADPETYGGAPDDFGDGIDQDCSGADGLDVDGDGYASAAGGGPDCDDGRATVHPGAMDGAIAWRKVSTERSEDLSNASLAIESNGVLHATWVRGTVVRHGRRAPDRSWTHGTIDDVGAGEPDPALALAPDDELEVVYRENVADELRWATNESGAWVHESVDGSGTPGTHNAIAIAADGTTHVVYVDSWDRDALQHATRSGGGWAQETIDATGAAGHDVAIAIDAAGAVHAAYAELGDEDLEHATNASGAWVVETIDAGRWRAHYVSIAIDADGAVHVAYRVGVDGLDLDAELWYATNASGAWRSELVDDTTDAARGTGIAVSASGDVTIAEAADGDLYRLTGAAGAWDSERITTGSYEGASLVIDPLGFTHVLSVETRVDDVDEWTDDVLPDGVDQNCDGVDGVDADGDGHASIASGGDDCWDADAALVDCG